MGYKKSCELPTELIEQIQQYVDGEMVYIPRKSDKRKNGARQAATIYRSRRETPRSTENIRTGRA